MAMSVFSMQLSMISVAKAVTSLVLAWRVSFASLQTQIAEFQEQETRLQLLGSTTHTASAHF